MDLPWCLRLLDLAEVALVAEREGEVVAFLLGFIDGAAYPNGNYEWFAARLKQFFYVDRIVVSEACRGEGIGRSMYGWVEAWARKAGMLSMAAEINVQPPNLVSLNFHRTHGFVPVGTRTLEGGKQVSMQVRSL